jgi:thiamine pyrophosphokinase
MNLKTNISRPAVLVIGGEMPRRSVVETLPHDPFVIAVDSGYRHARALELGVDVLIGDLDSITKDDLEHARVNVPILHTAPNDKDQTDTELAIEWALDNGHQTLVILYGGGDRIDHHLGVMHTLANPRLAGVDVVAYVGDAKVHVVHGPTAIELICTVGTTVGLVPIAGHVEGVTTAGLQWPLNDEQLVSWASRGVSNVTTDERVHVRIQSGVLLVIIHEEKN